jgi:hypothetical protein
MPVKNGHTVTPTNPTGNSFTRHRKRHNISHYRHALLHGKSGFSSPAKRPYVRSTSGQRQSMPDKNGHTMTPTNPTGNSFTRHRNRHNDFSLPPRFTTWKIRFFFSC